MPGNLDPAVITGSLPVLPYSLCTSYLETQSFPMLVQQYHDSTIERSLLQDGVNLPRPVRSWALSKRLTNQQLFDLFDFWENTTEGALKPFFYYDPFFDGVDPVGSNWDETGANPEGKVTVKFQGNWSHSVTIGRSDVSGLMLVEVG